MNRLLALCLIPFLLLPSCMTAGGNGFVGFATTSGNGDARTDGDTFVAMGLLQGEAGLFLKGSGFPLTYPLDLQEGEWAATSRTLKTHESGKLGVDPLPYWCASLFRPGEIEQLSTRLGVVITFRPPNP